MQRSTVAAAIVGGALLLVASAGVKAPCDASHRIMHASRAAPHDFPPEIIPEDLLDAYTRCGQIATADYYVDDMHGSSRRRQRFRSNQVAAALSSARDNIARVRSFPGPAAVLHKSLWLVVALVAFEDRIAGSKAAVVGSGSPMEAALLLALGAAHVSVVEYLPTDVEHPNVTGVSADGWVPAPGEFDIIVSMSSLDHDGLGRYGDPLCPDGDLLTMDALRAGLAPACGEGAPGRGGGLLFLSVPVGPDVLAWNLLRRYGRVRLPLLLEGWALAGAAEASVLPPKATGVQAAAALGEVAWRADALDDTSVHFSRSFEPVLVLTPTMKSSCDSDGVSTVTVTAVLASGDSEVQRASGFPMDDSDSETKPPVSAFDVLAAMPV